MYVEQLQSLFGKVAEKRAEYLCTEICAEVIEYCQSLGDMERLTSFIMLHTIWDEICVQVQTAQLPRGKEYEGILRRKIHEVMEDYDKYDKLMIWLQSDQGHEFLAFDEGRHDAEDYFREDGLPKEFDNVVVEDYIFHKVIDIASEYENDGIADYMEMYY